LAEIVFDIHIDSFSTLQTKTQNLSVLIGTNRFYYFVSNAAKQVLFQRHYLLDETQQLKEIRSILETDVVVRSSFNKINVSVDTPHFAFIPNEIYFPANQRSYLEQVATLSNQDMVFSDEVEELSIQNVHAVDSKLFDLLDVHFSSFRLYHSATTLLRRTRRIVSENEVVVNVLPKSLNIMVYKNHQFQLYNTFDYHSAEAFLYYIALMYQQFGLNVNETPLTLLGGIMPNSSIYRLLSTYIRQIRFAKRTKYYQFSPKYSAVPQQFYFDLYSLSVCE
jgi:hypothetical protein